jgi:hypothetical protein
MTTVYTGVVQTSAVIVLAVSAIEARGARARVGTSQNGIACAAVLAWTGEAATKVILTDCAIITGGARACWGEWRSRGALPRILTVGAVAKANERIALRAVVPRGTAARKPPVADRDAGRAVETGG